MRRHISPLFFVPVGVLVIALGLAGGVGRLDSEATGAGVARPGTPVSRPFVPDQTTIEECGRLLSCLEQALGNVAAANGPKVAWETLDRLIEAGTMDAVRCHLSAHRIGAGAMLWAEDDVAGAFSFYRSDCVDGYTHGAISGLLNNIASSDGPAMAQRIADACLNTYRWPNEMQESNCAHGGGHAIMLQSGYDLPLSLATCHLAFPADSIAESSALNCVNGAFMENFHPSYDVKGEWLDYGDPFAPCRTLVLDESDELSCWIHTTYALNRISLVGKTYDVAGFARACDSLDPLPRNRCYLGLGREIAVKRDVSLVVNACGLGRSGGAELACIFQAAYQMTANLSGLIADPGIDTRSLCVRLTNTETAEACWRSFGHFMLYDTAPNISGTIEERCLAYGVPAGLPLDFCLRSASGEQYAQGIPMDELP